MTRAQFLADFQDLLQSEAAIAPDTRLKDLEEWDSLAVMACMAYLDRSFGVKTNFAQYAQLCCVSDVMNLAQGRIQ